MKSAEGRRTRHSLGAEFLFEALTGAYVLCAVAFLWKYPILLTPLLFGGILLKLWFWRGKADAAMMAAAAVLGTPSEMLCVRLGVWSYHAPGLVYGIPVWIPLVWAYLFCLFRRISLSLLTLRWRVWPDREALFPKILFCILGGSILAYSLATVLLIIRPIAIVYTAFLIPAVIFWHEERDTLIFLIGGALGTLGEYICMTLGFWHYHFPMIRSIGLPLSLPLAWGLSAVITSRIARMWEKHPDRQ